MIKKGLLIMLVVVLLVSVSSFGVFAQKELPVEEEKYELAQKYKNAEPGEKFMIGHITWGLAQEYLMMCYQAS